MKKLTAILLILALAIFMFGCSDSSTSNSNDSNNASVTDKSEEQSDTGDISMEEENKITVNESSASFMGRNYEEVKQILEDYGFTNIVLEQSTYKYDYEHEDGVVRFVSAGDTLFGSSFDPGDSIDADKEMIINYYAYTPDPDQQKEEELPNLTVDNCEDLQIMLDNPADIDSSYTAFGIAYAGRTFEFDGCIRSVMNHDNYNTRYDVLISGGDFDPDHQNGPSFKFTNVSGSDMGVGLFAEDVIREGANVHVTAVVKFFDSSSGVFNIEPVKVTSR